MSTITTKKSESKETPENLSIGRRMIEIKTRWYDRETGEYCPEKPGAISIEYAECNGKYVGDPAFAEYLRRRGIFNPEPLPEEYGGGTVCCIGKSTDGKWYGWSHRGIYGFTIGDVAKEGDLTTMSGWIEECRSSHPVTEVPVGFRAETDEDAKRMAIAYAGAVA